MRAKYYIAAALLAVLSSPVLAEGYSSPWIFSANFGTEVQTSGNILGAANSSSLNMNTINSNLTGQGIMHLKGRKFSDMYYPSMKASVEVRYALSDLSEIYGSIGYLKAQSRYMRDLGCLEQGANTCALQLQGHLKDLTQISVEAGYRQWFGTGLLSEAVRPYWAVHGGLVQTGAIHGAFYAGTNGLGHWKLYDKGYSATIGADLGASYTISDTAELAAEVGVRYTGNLKKQSGDLNALGLAAALDDSHAISIPVNLRFHTTF